MSSERHEQLPDEIEKLHRDFVRRGWLDPNPSHRLERTQVDFLEIAQMFQNTRLMAAHTFGTTDQEKKDIYFNSRFGRLLSDMGDEMNYLARPVKSLILQPVSRPKPRNTSHPDKEAVTLLVLNCCAILIPYHKSKRSCFREVSELLNEHDTFLTAETIAKIWYARCTQIRAQNSPVVLRFYADIFIVTGGRSSPADGQPTHPEMIKKVMLMLGDILPNIPPDLRNATEPVRSPPV